MSHAREFAGFKRLKIACHDITAQYIKCCNCCCYCCRVLMTTKRHSKAADSDNKMILHVTRRPRGCISSENIHPLATSLQSAMIKSELHYGQTVPDALVGVGFTMPEHLWSVGMIELRQFVIWHQRQYRCKTRCRIQQCNIYCHHEKLAGKLCLISQQTQRPLTESISEVGLSATLETLTTTFCPFSPNFYNGLKIAKFCSYLDNSRI